MLIHIVPKIYEALVPCDIVDVSIPECGLVLVGGKDIVARRPYPNKKYVVGCRKQGRKAMNGIFVEVEGTLPSYTVITRWEAGSRIITHIVKHEVLDKDFDAVSDDMITWYSGGSPKFKNRWPDCYRKGVPVSQQPRMDVVGAEAGGCSRPADVNDFYEDRYIIRRTETFSLPTIERERVYRGGIARGRTPAIEEAFHAKPVDVPDLSIALSNGVTATLTLAPLIHADQFRNLLCPPFVFVSLFQNGSVIVQNIPWSEVITGSSMFQVSDTVTLDRDDLDTLDYEGWGLMMPHGLFPTVFIPATQDQ